MKDNWWHISHPLKIMIDKLEIIRNNRMREYTCDVKLCISGNKGEATDENAYVARIKEEFKEQYGTDLDNSEITNIRSVKTYPMSSPTILYTKLMNEIKEFEIHMRLTKYASVSLYYNALANMWIANFTQKPTVSRKGKELIDVISEVNRHIKNHRKPIEVNTKSWEL